MWWKKHDNIFSRFDRVPARDRQTDGRTDGQTDVQPISSTCFSIAVARNKNEKIRVTLRERIRGTLQVYMVNKMCADGQKKVQGWNKLMIMSIVTRSEETRNDFSSWWNVDKDVAARTRRQTVPGPWCGHWEVTVALYAVVDCNWFTVQGWWHIAIIKADTLVSCIPLSEFMLVLNSLYSTLHCRFLF